MKLAMRSEVGHVRQVNEDRAAFIQDMNGFTLAIVADGIGGQQAGEIASEMAVEFLQRKLVNLSSGLSDQEYIEAIRVAMDETNAEIFRKSQENDTLNGMGTTVVLALITEESVFVAHVGDSRCYHFSDGHMASLTHDHSFVNELVKKGQISEDEALTHPRRNVILRAIGTDECVEVDIEKHRWDKGEVLLLCSDGLTDLVDEATIRQVIATHCDVEQTVRVLIDKALEAGGDDNITVLIVSNT